MNIYKMKDKDLTKYSTKFNKTVFGKRAKIFATTPIVLGIVFIVLLIYQMINNPSNISFDNSTITILSICFLISFLSLCITQLMYSRMLKDYISSLTNEDKKKDKDKD